MGKSVRNTNPVDLSDEVAQSLGLSPKSASDTGIQLPPKGQPQPKKQTSKDISDEIGQSLGLKKKDGGDDGSNQSAPIASPSASPSLDDANKNFTDRKLTGADVNTLAETDQGKQMGLPSLSQEGKTLYAEAHNGPKRSDYVNSINKMVDDYYPFTGNQQRDKIRQQIKVGVMDGNQDAILSLRDNVIASIQKQIDQRSAEVMRPITGMYADQAQRSAVDSDSTVQHLKSQQDQVRRTLNEYGQLSLATGKDMQPWLKLDSDHPNMLTSEAADKLGKMIEGRYGVQSTGPNKEFDRMRTGFELIIKSLQIDANALLTAALPSGDKETLKKAQDKLNTIARYRDMYDRLDTEQFPDVGLDRTARMLGDIIAEKHPNKLIRTKEDVYDAALTANERNPGFLEKYGPLVDIAAEKQGEGTFIPRGGGAINEFLSGLQKSSAQTAIDLLKWKGRVMNLSDVDKADIYKETSPGLRGTTASKSEQTRIVFDKEGKAYRELPNENYSTLPWNNFFRFAGESTPGLLEFIATEGTSKEFAAGLSFGRMGKEAKELSGLVGATYLTSYNSNREFADANIDDNTAGGEAKKIIAANFMTLANAGVFHILGASPSKIVEAAVSKNVMPEVIDLFENNSWEKLSEKQIGGIIKNSILPRAKAVVAKFAETAGSGFKMGSASVIDQKVKDFVGVISNPKYTPSPIEDNARDFVSQALLITTIGLPGIISTGLVPHSSREALHQAGLYAPQYINMINARVEDGSLDEHKAAGMISMVKTIAEELAKAKVEKNDDGTPLTTRQQRDLAIANFRKRGAAAMEENNMGTPKRAESEADNEIKEIKKENNWQAIEETPTFKSVTEVDENGKKVAKVKSMEDIDPAKQYNYVHNEEGEVTIDGATLINHLETGDIYDKEKEPDQTDVGNENPLDKTEKATDAESENNQPAEDKEEAPVTVKSAAVQVGDNVYEGTNHGEAIEKAKEAGEDVSNIDQEKDGMFRLSDGSLIDRQEAKARFGGDHSHELVPEEIVKKAADEGKLGVMADTAKANPEEFLKNVADQALGYTRDQGERVKSDIPDAEKAAREQYGNDVVDAAIKMFPDEKPVEEKLDTEANANIASHLQASYDRLIAGGADPNDSEMTRLRERIESLSPKIPDNAQNDEKTEGVQREEVGGGGEDAASGNQEGAEKEEKVVPPEVTPPGAPPPTPAKDSPVIGIRDSIVNEDRIHRGLKPLVKEFTRSWGANWNRLRRNIADGFSPRNFIENTAARLANGERIVFTDYDYATLLFDRLNTLNNLELAKDQLQEVLSKKGGNTQPNLSSLGQETAAQDLIKKFSDELEQNDIVGRQIKSETGRALSAIQMIADVNGKLLRWSDEMAAYYNGNVPEKIKSFVERIQQEYKETNEKLQAHIEELKSKAAEGTFNQSKKSSGKGKKSVTLKGKELADKIRSLRPKGGIAQANLFGLPIAVYDTALVAVANAVEGGARLVDVIGEALKDIAFPSEEDKNRFIAHLQNQETPESPQAIRAGYLEDISNLAQEKGTTSLHPDMVKPLKKMMESYVQDGSASSLDDLVRKTHEDLKDILPNTDERDLRDAFSGYGVKSHTKGQTEQELAKLKEEARKVSVYQDALERPSGETQAQEAKRLGKAAELRKDVEGYMREAGVFEEPPAVSPEAKNALALERVKKRTQSIIESLNEQILAGERKERNGVKSDADLDMLRAERKRLSDQLNEIEQSKITPEEKIKRTEDALNRQIANYERQIRDGVDPMRPKEDRPTSKQIDDLRKRKNELKRQVEALRNDADPNMSPEQRAILKYNESLANRIRDLEERLKNKDYETAESPVVDISKDRITVGLEARLKKLQGDWYYTKRGVELSQRPLLKKLMSLASTTKRAFVLSRISTFGRLIAADIWSNLVFEPAESVMASTSGYVGTKIGFARKLSGQAERFGMPTSMKEVATIWKGEWQALKSVTTKQAWKDFVSDATKGYNELSLLYDQHAHSEVPKELRDHWQNIEHGLEVFGRAHGSVKGLSKRMEFTRSYMIRKEALRRKGADVENPVIQASIGAMSYQDAMRHILMENNLISNQYQEWINNLRKGGIGANLLALTLNELMPIVKIPTNLVLNAGRSTLGFPLAGGVIAVRGLVELMTKGNSEYGISKLSPEKSDALLRNLRKGQIGMALMLAGYFAPSMFGASHYYQKGDDQPDGMEEGDVMFGGVKVPRWLADNPYLVSMKIGASLRSSYNYYSDTEDNSTYTNAAKSFFHTLGGAIQETPLIGTPGQTISALEGRNNNFWYNQVKSTLEPGLLQEIAEWQDKENGWFSGPTIKRKPKSLGESLETGIPGLRENVDQP